MDFDLRQWLLILGPVFIIGVLLHGYFRMRAGRNDIRMKLDKQFLSAPGEAGDVDDLSLLKAELPNGGARVIAADLAEDTDSVAAAVAAEVPMLDDNVELPPISALDSEPLPDLQDDLPEISALPAEDFPDIGKAPPAKLMPEPEPEPEPEPARVESEPAPVQASSAASPVTPKPEKFVVINVLALDEPFPGQAMLELLLNAEMTFGEMDIFHKLGDDNEPEFSLANAVEPGTFDVARMEAFSTPGVTMFMRVHELAEPLRVLDDMLEVADTLARDLNGEVRDETRSVMTPQTIEHCRQSIREFQFKHSA